MAKYKILVVDYEPRGIQQLTEPLESAGHEIVVAKDGLAAIEVFEALHPDVTVIEAMLPKKGGFEVCQDLKQTPHGMKSPIVVVSAVYRGRKYRTQALHHYGADEFLEKPIAPEKLLEVVTRLLPSEPRRGPAPEAAPAPAPTETTVEIVTDEPAPHASPEDEISERLDEILSTDGPSRSVVPDFKGENLGDRVVSFDPERVRRRREERAPAGSATATTGHTTVGGHVPGPRAVGTTGNAHAIHEAEPTAAADRRIAEPLAVEALEPRSHRFGLWLGAAIVIVLAAIAAFVMFAI